MGVRLPAEYQEVEYLEATGTQAFFTDVPIQDNITVDSVQTISGGDTYLFGGHNGKGLQASFNGYYGGRLQSSYSGYYAWAHVNPDNKTIYHVVLTQKNAEQIGVLNGSQVLSGTHTTTGDTSAGDTAALFGQRSNGSLGLFYKGKVYSCKVSKDGTLLADFVPCYRKADGEIGMYDLVLQKFYVNEGTGVFLKGNDVIDSISPWLVAWRRGLMKSPYLYKLPSPVTFNGSTDFLDTGVKLMEEDIDFSIELSFVNGEDTKVNYSGVFYCVSEFGAYPGISLQRYSNKAYYCIGGATSDVDRVLTNATYSPGTEIRMVIRKVKGETTRTIDFAVDGVRKARANKPGDWEKNKNNVSLLLGCCIQTNGNRFRYWAGTINDFKIKNMVVSDAYVDKYLTAN